MSYPLVISNRYTKQVLRRESKAKDILFSSSICSKSKSLSMNFQVHSDKTSRNHDIFSAYAL